MVQNERKFMRTDFYVNGYFNEAGETITFKVVNLSLKGALIHLDEEMALQKNQTMDLSILLTHSDVKINARGNVVHICQDGSYGIKFESIDLDSMIHLRRLLELNTVPEGEIERELNFLKD
ncbi:MAG: PilZ domain-containing protein [Spirochaetales bacterium]|nr:PilZ domain-containing protein [Spirochaetales bacterium]